MSINRDIANDILAKPRPKSSPGLRPIAMTSDEPATEDDSYRATPEYYEWYHAQHDRNPRVPPPVMTWRHYQMGYTRSSPGTRNLMTPPDGAMPLDTPDMIPRNLLDSTTPAQTPQIQPIGDSCPMPFMLPPVTSSPNCSLSGFPAGMHNPHAQQVKSPPSAPLLTVTSPESQTAQQAKQRQADEDVKSPPITVTRTVAQSDEHQDNTSPRKPPTSALMTEFRARGSQRWDLMHLKGHVLEFSMDQEGSRFIQRLMDTASREARSMVCEEVVPHARDLTTDVFGNYVVQKTLEYGTDKQRHGIVEGLYGCILELTMHTYGCRVVQKALDVVDRRARLRVADELRNDVIRCIHDQNGNHVLQKCIEVVPDSVEFIVSSLRGNTKEIACHAYGCRVMQRLLEQCESTLRQDKLLDEMVSCTKEIVKNQYGNYVVQHVIINADDEHKKAILDVLFPELFELACHKFASNVVEKVVMHTTPAIRSRIVDMWVNTNADDGYPWVIRLVTNQYGNYVVQRMFEAGNEDQQKRTAKLLAEHLPYLKQYQCARHIIPHIERGAGIASSTSPSAAPRGDGNNGSGKGSGRSGGYHGGSGHHTYQTERRFDHARNDQQGANGGDERRAFFGGGRAGSGRRGGRGR
eukprot:PhM_4_TR10557/c0_g1_i1/m.44348/K17943/PUM; pumilio RNA-binding family